MKIRKIMQYGKSTPVIDIKCKNCNKKFTARLYYVKHGQGIFCSNKCHMQYISRKKIWHKAKNPNWKGGISKDKYHYKKLQILRYPEKVEARKILAYHVKQGYIKRLPCEICNEKKVQAHHENYSKPLEIRWLCRKHHREL
jgi:hypothetical protein